MPPIKGGGLGGGGNGPTLIRTSDIAPTQAEVNILRGDGVSIVDKASDIRINGFDPAEAIDVIKVDGGYLTLDHRRLESAVWAGEDYIPGNIHLYTDRVSPNVANRFEFYGDAPFSDLTTRNTFRLGDTPSTWGEAALVRTVNQQYSRAGNLVRDYPNFKFGQAPTYMSAPGDATGKAWMEYIRALQNSSN